MFEHTQTVGCILMLPQVCKCMVEQLKTSTTWQPQRTMLLHRRTEAGLVQVVAPYMVVARCKALAKMQAHCTLIKL
jgi:hypothetical protein